MYFVLQESSERIRGIQGKFWQLASAIIEERRGIIVKSKRFDSKWKSAFNIIKNKYRNEEMYDEF